jgi:hypothetical protein
MLFTTSLSPAIQAEILRNSLAENGRWVSVHQAEELVRSVAGLELTQAARQLCSGLKRLRISLKHMQALALLGKLQGQPHIYVKTHNPDGPRYRLIVVSMASVAGVDLDEYSTNPASLLEKACTQIHTHGHRSAYLSVATLRRGDREVNLTCWGAHPNGLLLLIQAPPGADTPQWNTFADRASEQLRRTLEHSQNCFCDGYAVACDPEARRPGITALTVTIDGLQLARGNELLIYRQIEKYLGKPFTAATAEMNSLEIDGKASSWLLNAPALSLCSATQSARSCILRRGISYDAIGD